MNSAQLRLLVNYLLNFRALAWRIVLRSIELGTCSLVERTRFKSSYACFHAAVFLKSINSISEGWNSASTSSRSVISNDSSHFSKALRLAINVLVCIATSSPASKTGTLLGILLPQFRSLDQKVRILHPDKVLVEPSWSGKRDTQQ